MKCSYCGNKIALVPSAQERSVKFGKPASFYTRLFNIHGSCQIEKREQETKALIDKYYRE